MSERPSWLPGLILLDDFAGSWERYENEVYAVFYRDFVESSPLLEGLRVCITKQLIRGKERTFGTAYKKETWKRTERRIYDAVRECRGFGLSSNTSMIPW
ncbi:MAG: hypothetical protein JW741_27240 [Sedimentisphaerales bacterium]|nr:hypothetical protein [Sedimentisphaerales bacterium]